MRRAAPAALVCMLALVAAACGGGGDGPPLVLEPIERGPSSPIVVPPGEPIVVGTSSALTGPVGQRGREYRDAAILGVNRWKSAHGELIEGHEIVVQAEDDGCTEADITVGAAERLMRRSGLVGVLGPQCSAGASAAIPVYREAGVLAISGSATTSDLTLDQPEDGFFFRTAYTNRFEGELNGQFVAELGADTVYIVHDGEAYGSDLATTAAAALSDRSVEVTVSSIRRGQVDFGELAAKVARANPDFVGFAGFNPEAALFYRQLRDAGYKGPFGAGDAAASVRDFVGPVGPELAEGVYFGGCSLDLADEFVGEFRRLHGSEPTAAFVTHYADAAGILLSAIAEVAKPQPDGSLTIDPGALRRAVRSTSVEDGFSGHVAFDVDGDRTTEETALDERARDLGLAVCQVRKGQLAVIFPE
ncbi:MAG: branched-chain amino acid ABC transporter substrate-binding protein [Gaiellaceae bacterium]